MALALPSSSPSSEKQRSLRHNAAIEEWRLRADVQVGEGTFGRVYKATRVATGKIVALKKSRASLALNNTLLNHERRLLQLLNGHPSIPEVLAYGRLKHFEYLAMELAGIALNDVCKQRLYLPAANILVIADQMISALKHVHKNGFVHCDLKPGNILLHPTDPTRLYLIDYGYSRAIAPSTPISSNTPSYHVVGTLPYASLNMHYGIPPAPRDDIESLGYSLLHLASGDLPWLYNVWHGTRKAQYDQVWIKKQRYSGADLAPDGLSFIGAMIDHARSLNFDELPNYKLFRLQVQEARERAGLLDSFVVDWNIPSDALIGDRSPCPVPNDPSFALRSGQIVCCQIDARTTLEGYSARAGDPSFWRDPSLSHDKWNTVIRPAVVLQAQVDKRTLLWTIQVICIGRGALISTEANMVPISLSPTNGSVMPSPTWPFSDSYCYAFPQPMKFFCYPGEVQPVSSPWMLGTSDINFLRQKFDNYTLTQTLSRSEKRYYDEKPFVKVTALGLDLEHGNADGEPIEWEGRRAWFDDYLALAQRREAHELAGVEQDASRDRTPLDSYWEWDFELWENYLGELSSSITEGIDDRAGLLELPSLPVIVDVEVSKDVLYQASLK